MAPKTLHYLITLCVILQSVAIVTCATGDDLYDLLAGSINNKTACCQIVTSLQADIIELLGLDVTEKMHNCTFRSQMSNGEFLGKA